MATIKLKNGSGAPLASDLVQGEPALDLTNKRLYTEDAGGAIIEVGVNPTELNVTGDIAVGGTVDGRDIATDGAKLDGVEALADVTDTTNVTAAGALMDSELTSEASVKALNQGVATTDSPTFAGLTTTASVSFGDNDKAIFGAGSDLQIYHDGSNSIIQDLGTGNLNILANAFALYEGNGTDLMIGATPNGAVTLSHNAQTKLATTSTGIDVTGTVTADGLTVTGTLGNWSIDAQGAVQTFTRPSANYIRASDASGSLRFDTGGSLARMNIANNGDVSLFEDTGTTEKFLWDASQERLELDSANANPLVLERDGGTDANVSIQFNCATNDWYAGTNPANNFAIGTSLDQTNAPFQIDASGNVGVGTDSPASQLEISNAASAVLRLSTSDTSVADNQEIGALEYFQADASGAGAGVKASIRAKADNDTAAQTYLAFQTSDSSTNDVERVRIDSSGNLLVSGTSTTPWGNATGTAADSQFIAREDGIMGATAYKSTTDVGYVGYFNRTATDGGILAFNKNGTTVGSIGSIGGVTSYIDGGSTYTGLAFNASSVAPRDAGAGTNGTVDLGASSARFKDLYLSGGAYLGGTAAANKLDDYEEGTFTPTLTFGGVDTGNVYGVQEGTYTKIGNTVYVTASVRLTTLGSGTGNAEISGLPFTVSAGSEKGGGSASYYIALAGLTSAPVIRAGTGGTLLELRDGSATASNRLTHGNFTTTSDIRITATYFV